MGNISVSKKELQYYQKLLTSSRNTINSTLVRLLDKTRYAQSTWSDANYRKLEEIIEECVSNIKTIYEIIYSADQYLNSLEAIVSEYEDFHPGNGNVSSEQSFLSSIIGGTRGSDGNSRNLSSLKNGLRNVDKKLDTYKQALLSRGVADNSALEAVIQHYRHQLQAGLLDEINGMPPAVVNDPDYDSIASSLRQNNLDLYNNPTPVARDLVKTKYGFQNISFNGKEMCVYDDPIGTHSLLIKEQGNSNYRMCGTCGLCQSANIMTMAGVPTTENDIISIALHSSDGVLHSMELFEEDPDERGGTTVNNRKEILESQGIPITNLPINIDRARTVRQLASAVASGHGVILSVDVERLWRNGQSGGHAISLLSVSRDGSTFIYSDTGAGEINTISAVDLAAALTGRPANVTTNIIR